MLLRSQTGAVVSLTTGERQALRWLSAVIMAGAGFRLASHWQHRADADPVAAEALSRQLLAVDSAQRASGAGRRRSGGAGVRSGRRRGSGGQGGTVAADPVGESGGRSEADREQQPRLAEVVDVDRADSSTLERLPRIGPALASRIVADRGARGPFGSIEALQRVRGIGPKLANGLRSRVTFSATPRPSSVQR
jgi:DNA uptake protein ComE-like DNA-binding protein